MKKYLTIFFATLLAVIIFSSCKKETTTVAKDYSLSIKGKTWWGTFTNAGESPQYYSVSFSADNLILWSQFSGDYTGQYAVDKNKLIMIFINPSVVVTADITDDNKLANITSNTANKVNSGELVANPNISLDNTIWKGGSIQLSFLAGSRVQTKLGITTPPAGAYVRSASGGAIRLTVPVLLEPMFGVITSDGVMNGSYVIPGNTWQLTKQ
jgi:hypothetical protein